MSIPITARVPVEFTPPSVPGDLLKPDAADREKPKFRILVRVPTMMERDSYSAALIRGGVIAYTRQQIRDLALAGVQHLFDEPEHEDIQARLIELWAAADADGAAQEKQLDRLRELHEAAKARGEIPDPKVVTEELAAIQPDVVIDGQRRVKALAINQEIMARYEPLREALAALTDQDAKRAWLNAEVYVEGWTGLKHTPDGNGRGGLQKHEAEYLREQIGQRAFDELSDFITSLQGIDGDEEKNLASLLESTSARIGSTQPESKASSGDGNSMDEPSTSTRARGSRKTTASSSSSTTSSATKTARSRKSSPTAAPSSTSPSS